MRAIVVLLAAAWVLGVASGVFESWVLLTLGGLLIIFIAWHSAPRHFPLLGALLAILLLGVIRGEASRSSSVFCTEVELPIDATIDRIHKSKEDSTSYSVTTIHQCRLLVTTSRWPVLAAGEGVTVDGTVMSLNALAQRNQGYARYLKQRGFSAVVSFARVRRLSEDSSLATTFHSQLRHQITRVIPEPASRFVSAMLLADPVALPAAFEEQLRRTGTSHLIAISGFNISLLAGIIVVALLMTPLPAGIRTGLTVGLLWSYIILIGFPISAVRAAWFWSVALLGARVGRLVSLPTAFILTATSLVTYNPSVLADIGFQLSFAAVCGIGLALFMARFTVGPWSARSGVLAAILTTVGATLTTWPISAYYFGTVSLITVAANLLVEPVFPALMVVSLLTVAFSFVNTPLALFGGFIIHLLYNYMDVVTGLLSRVPAAYLTDLSLPGWFMGAYYTALVLGAHLWLRYHGRSWREIWQ